MFGKRAREESEPSSGNEQMMGANITTQCIVKAAMVAIA